MKIDKDAVEEVIRNTVTDPAVVDQIIQQLNERARQEQEEQRANAEQNQAGEKRNVVILLSAQEDIEQLRELAERTTALAVQIDAERNHMEVVDAILRGGAAYNDTKRRASQRVVNLAEACEVVSPKKHLEGFPRKIYTKEPALIVVSTNLPVTAIAAVEG
jgi:hypothetical protein